MHPGIALESRTKDLGLDLESKIVLERMMSKLRLFGSKNLYKITVESLLFPELRRVKYSICMRMSHSAGPPRVQDPLYKVQTIYWYSIVTNGVAHVPPINTLTWESGGPA